MTLASTHRSAPHTSNGFIAVDDGVQRLQLIAKWFRTFAIEWENWCVRDACGSLRSQWRIGSRREVPCAVCDGYDDDNNNCNCASRFIEWECHWMELCSLDGHRDCLCPMAWLAQNYCAQTEKVVEFQWNYVSFSMCRTSNRTSVMNGHIRKRPEYFGWPQNLSRIWSGPKSIIIWIESLELFSKEMGALENSLIAASNASWIHHFLSKLGKAFCASWLT